MGQSVGVQMFTAIKDRNLFLLKELLENDPSAKKNVHCTIQVGSNGACMQPIHIACFYYSAEIVDYLMEIGCDVNARTTNDELGNTPLHIAFMEGNIELVSRLVSNSASIEIKNWEGLLPEQVASIAMKEHIFKEMITKKTSIATAWTEIPYIELKIDISDDGLLGYGSYGTVRKATWKGLPVAVKEFHAKKRTNSATNEAIINSFKNELDTMASLRHPHVVMLIGGCTIDPSHSCLVLELMEKESLYNILHDQKIILKAKQIKQIIVEMLHGLSFLHRNNMMHRDIKSSNILVNGEIGANMHVKLADFGISKTVIASNEHHTANQGTLNWMAPEVMKTTTYGYKADIWSMSMVMYELLTNQVPFANEQWYKNASSYSKAFKEHVRKKGDRPKWTKHVDSTLKKIIEQCWNADPAKRPTCDMLLVELEQWNP